MNRFETGIKEYFGRNVAPHYVVKRPDYHDMTYGGIHETEKEAVNARKLLVDAAYATRYGKGSIDPRLPQAEKDRLTQLYNEDAAQAWRKAPIIELNVGDRYSPWGDRYSSYTHGKDDGTHGSKHK